MLLYVNYYCLRVYVTQALEHMRASDYSATAAECGAAVAADHLGTHAPQILPLITAARQHAIQASTALQACGDRLEVGAICMFLNVCDVVSDEHRHKPAI